jgi:hypothetical protein
LSLSVDRPRAQAAIIRQCGRKFPALAARGRRRYSKGVSAAYRISTDPAQLDLPLIH